MDVTGVAGVGNNKLNHVEISTSQGYQYNSWFYMGAGLGIDVVRSAQLHPWLHSWASYAGPAPLQACWSSLLLFSAALRAASCSPAFRSGRQHREAPPVLLCSCRRPPGFMSFARRGAATFIAAFVSFMSFCQKCRIFI